LITHTYNNSLNQNLRRKIRNCE